MLEANVVEVRKIINFKISNEENEINNKLLFKFIKDYNFVEKIMQEATPASKEDEVQET